MSTASVRHSRGVWGLTVGPTIWALHFLACYAGGAVFCAKLVGEGSTMAQLQQAIAAVTALALAGIAVVGWRAWHRWGFTEGAQPPHDADTPEDRERFLGLSILLLSGLSFVATLYTALVGALAASCR
jgi:hypothetical protein